MKSELVLDAASHLYACLDYLQFVVQMATCCSNGNLLGKCSEILFTVKVDGLMNCSYIVTPL